MHKFTCPECGAWFYASAGASVASLKGGWSSAGIRVAEAAGAGMVPADIEAYESVRPAAAPDPHTHFVTPFLQAIATGLAFFVIAGVVSIVWRLSFWLPFLVGATAFALAWLLLLGRFNGLLVAREFIQSRAPDPLPDDRPVPRVVVEVHDRGSAGSQVQIAELPVDVDRLGTLARAVASGQELSYGRWTGRGKLLSRGELGAVYDWLVRCGLAYWKNPDRHQEGLEFTAGGRRLWARLAAGEYAFKKDVR